VPPPPPGGEGIARRVPGAHLAGLDITLPAPDTAPITAGLTIDPELVRRQILDVEQAVDRAEQAAQGVEAEPVPPPVAEVARRSGISRRVPGAALANLDAALPGSSGGGPTQRHSPAAEPGAGAGIDAEHLRSELDAFDQALLQARVADDTGSITAERLAVQAAEPPAAEPAAAEPAVAPPPAAEPAAAEPAVAPPPAAPPPPVGEPASAPLTRRVRGASLSSFVSSGAPPRHATGSNGSRGLRNGPFAVVPERPEDVLAWASDLEATMVRVLGSDGRPTTAGAENVGSEQTEKPSAREGEGT
jgi:hypothetical protein